ncbi:glycosyltransferase family 2 protein [Paraglaciecola agarilytica]|uniref:glycosyltransferase family 2 protein n=1 Tax=Paraglaciecola chathamensis TaxID=368405 RepID=UPI001C096C0B|nr:glycosyltransferase family A protein [Paraglaciecola agarilytica]MBU3016151.1 glycosyltransferase family 2 protein [Paraglaciecola agarilytica]
MPFFSIVIPVFNGARHIEKCLDSIFSQGFINHEVIVVNDGSTDDTDLILSRSLAIYGAERLKVLSIENSGVSLARNLGLKAACGQYIIFVDVDDWILPGYFQFAFSQLLNSNLDGLLLNYYTGSDTEYNQVSVIPPRMDGVTITGNQFGKLFLLRNITNNPWDKIFARALLLKSKEVFPVDICVGEDAVGVLKTGIQAKSLMISTRAYLVYMEDTGGVTKRPVSDKMVSDIGVAVNEMEIILDGKYPKELIQMMRFRQVIHYVFNGNYEYVERSETLADFKKTISQLSIKNCHSLKWGGIALILKFSVFMKVLNHVVFVGNLFFKRKTG